MLNRNCYAKCLDLGTRIMLLAEECQTIPINLVKQYNKLVPVCLDAIKKELEDENNS